MDKIPTPEPTPESTPDPTIFNTPELTKAQNKKSKHRISPFKLHKTFCE